MNEAKNDMEHGLHHMQQVIARPVRALESNLIYHHRRAREERRKERKLEKKEKMPLLNRFKKGKESETAETDREAESFQKDQIKQRERQKEGRTQAASQNPGQNRQKEPNQNKNKTYSQSKQGYLYGRNEPEKINEEPESLAARIYVEADEIHLLEERLGQDFYLEKQEYLDGYMLVLESEKLEEVTKALESQSPDLNAKLENYFGGQDQPDQREQQRNEYEYEYQYSDSISISDPPLEPLPDYDLYQQAAVEMETEADRDKDIDIEPEPGRAESQVDFAELEKSLLHDLQLEAGTETESDIDPALSAPMEPSAPDLKEAAEAIEAIGAIDAIEKMNPVEAIDQELEKELDLVKELEFDLDDFF